MIYLKPRNKVEHIKDCPRCNGRGSFVIGSGLSGYAWLCHACVGGKVVTFPWTRGRSLPPLVPRIGRHRVPLLGRLGL